MLKWVTGKLNLKRTTEVAIPVLPRSGARDGFPLQSADELLATAGRQRALQQLWDNCPFSRPVWEGFWLTPVRALAVRLQQLPAAPTGPYAKKGGMLDEALEVAVCAVRLSRGRMLPPGAVPEEQAAQGGAWCSAVFWAALLHDVGALHKMAVFQEDGSRWYPQVAAPECPWSVSFSQGEGDPCAWGAMMAYRLLPEEGLRWLSRWPRVTDTLLIYLSGNKKASAILHAAVSEARLKCGLLPQDIIPEDVKKSVKTAGTLPQNAPDPSSEHALVKPVISSIAVISKSYTRSQSPDATPPVPVRVSAIEQNVLANEAENETVIARHNGGNPGDWLTVLETGERTSSPENVMIPETMAFGPVAIDAQAGTSLTPGEHFWQWLIAALAGGLVTVNAQDSLLHVMTQYVFLPSPACFYRYLSAQKNAETHKDVVQKSFEALNHHFTRNGKGLFIYRQYENEKRTGRYTKLSGYMIPLTLIFTHGSLPKDSPWLSPDK